MTGPTALSFGEAWIAAYFAEVDRMDPDGLMAWYAEDCSFRFASQPRVEGKAAIRQVLAGFYGSIRSMRHHRTGVWVDADAPSGVWEADVTFVMPDGRPVSVPAVSVLRLRGGLVHDFRFVMDASALRDTAQGTVQ